MAGIGDTGLTDNANAGCKKDSENEEYFEYSSLQNSTAINSPATQINSFAPSTPLNTEESKKRKCQLSPLENITAAAGIIDTKQLIEGINKKFDDKMKIYMKQTKTELERHSQSLVSKFETKMESQMKAIRDSFTLDMANVVSSYEKERKARQELENTASEMKTQIEKIQLSVKDLETNMATAQAAAVEATTAIQNADIRPAHDPESTRFLVKGLHCGGIGGEPDLKIAVQGVIDAINVKVRLRNVEYIKSRRDTGSGDNPPGLILVTVDSVEDRTRIMRAKGKLKRNDTYKDVYMFPDRPRNERVTEGRFRKIVDSIPNLEWNKGRIQQKPE